MIKPKHLMPSLCLSVTLGLAPPVAAETLAELSEKDYLEEVPIVLSVSRLPQRLDETPGAVTLLDRQMIRMSGARDVADLLRLVPGFRVSSSFESTAPQASYHGDYGVYSNRLQVMVDGRSVYSPFFFGGTGPGLQTVAIEDIERIEVLRGSNSAAYGARAFLGTINIVTRDTVDTMGTQAQVATGDNGILDTLARLGWGDDRARFRLTADHRSDYGLSGASGPNRVQRINLRADLRTSISDQVEIRLGQAVIDAGVGFANEEGNAPRTRSIDSAYVQLDWRRNLGPDQDVTLQFSHSTENQRDQFRYLSNTAVVIDTSGNSTNDNLSLQHTLRYSPDLRLVWGGELRRETVVSRPLYATDAAFNTDFSRLFGNAEWRLRQNLILNLGGMYERSNLSGEHVSPRLMLNWHVVPGQTLRYGLSQAYRPPSTFEKYANVRYYLGSTLVDSTFVARGGVGSEKVLSREVGYLGDFPSLGFNLDVRVFHEEVRDVVRKSPEYDLPGSGTSNTKVSDFINGDNFDIRGVEYQLKWRPWAGAQTVFSQSRTESGWTDNGTLTVRPVTSTALMFMQQLPQGVDVSLMYYQYDQAKFQGNATIGAAISRTDLRFAKALRLGGKRAEVSWVLQNLGVAYQDYLPDFYFRRQAYVMLRLEN